ncbi:MAG: ribosome assembly cofactor RimP [Candidatus Cloacimonetes bacterium]|nr:ribosome assembly cofactor RimP [Candidatus Cloacimonadota bacterium]
MDKKKERIEEIARQVCQDLDLALYDLDLKSAHKGTIVLIYITKINGVSVGDCQQVSRTVGAILEEEDLIAGRYFLEVSSPGLERELKRKKHYVSAINELLKLTYHELDKNMTVTGTLLEVMEDSILLEVDEQPVEISFNDIRKARTYFDFKKVKKQG